MSEIILRLSYKHEKPLQLNEFGESIACFSKEYRKHANQKQYNHKSPDLLIRSIKEGSVVLDLASALIPILPELSPVMTFAKFYVERIFRFAGNEDLLISDKKPEACKNLMITGNNTIIFNQTVDSPTCKLAQNRARQILDQKDAEVVNVSENCWFVWAVTNFAEERSRSKDRGIIESFDKSPHPVVFESLGDRDWMSSGHEEFNGVEWQDIIYLVDVEVVKINNKIKGYRILTVHKEQCIPGS